MRVVVAKSAGFCQGVRRAIGAAEQLALDGAFTAVCTDGPLIHNSHETARLAALGVRTLSPGEVPSPGSVLMVRAHGVSPRRMATLTALPGVKVHDATCPFVRNIQNVCREESESGRFVLILGDAGHAEVQGLSGCAEGRCAVVSGPEELKALPDPGLPVSLVSQSTRDEASFAAARAAALERWPDARVINTICGATRTRQSELTKLAEECDAIVVVGSPHSANTRRLAEIAGRSRPVFLAEDATSLDPAAFAHFRTVGLAAGASTPDSDISAVRGFLEKLNCQDCRQGQESP